MDDIKEKNIENYYKNIEKPIINNFMNNVNLKNLLNLTTIIDLSVFTPKKNKKEWKLKDKRTLLKECEIKRKYKIKEATQSITSLTKNKSNDTIEAVKNKNENILNDISNINTLIETIEKNYPETNNYLEIFSNN